MKLEKPPYGSPCNGCGACCEAVPCMLASIALGVTQGTCPALSYDGMVAVCGLVKSPSIFARSRIAAAGDAILSSAAKTLIGSGIGCDAQLEDEPENADFRKKMEAIRQEKNAEIMEALKAWGII